MFRGWIGGTVYRRAHRYSYVLATGHIIGPQDVVMHSCDNPTCVNPAHLSVGTQAENQFEKYRKGRARIPAGEKSVHAKLTEAQATAIMADARPYAEIAAEYGVAPATVGDIKNRKSWKVVENPIVLKAKRRGMRGETQWQARLTADDVRTIRASKESGKELARRFGVSPQTICDIRKGRKWQHVS